MPRQLKRDELHRSDVVANCRMNRERGLVGSNGYERVLGVDLAAYLRETCRRHGRAAWLDLCCGSGKALIEAAEIAAAESLPLEIIGVDLVGMFAADADRPRLRLVKSAVEDFRPPTQCDLITSVHGLHYLGDKLGVITQAAGWLTESGRFVANLDAKSIRVDGEDSATSVIRALRQAGFRYSPRSKLLTKEGRCELQLPLVYLGADDAAGPNYTGQPAVDSYYAWNGELIGPNC